MAKRINGRVQMRESELRRTVADAVSRAFNVSITVALMSVHDEFGFGGQRLRRTAASPAPAKNEQHDAAAERRQHLVFRYAGRVGG